MRYLKYVALLVLLALPAAYSQAQIAIGVQIGPSYGIYNAPPVCEYGFYPAYPFGCAPYGYYGPEWFADGIFIGAGPWYNFYYTHAGFYRPFYVNRGFGFHRGFVRFHEDRFRGDGFRSFRGDDRRFRDRDDFRGRGFRDRDDFRGRGFRDRDDFRGRGRDDDHGHFRGGEGFRNAGYRSFNNGGDRAFRDGGRSNGGGRSYGRGESHGGGRSYGNGGSHGGGGRSYGGGSHNSSGGSHGGGGSRGGGHR